MMSDYEYPTLNLFIVVSSSLALVMTVLVMVLTWWVVAAAARDLHQVPKDIETNPFR